jgi:phage terminase large subunit
VYFDKAKTERLIQCLRRYRRTIPVSTNEPGAPLHDEYSHGADAFRYLGLVAPGMTNDAALAKKIAYSNGGIY